VVGGGGKRVRVAAAAGQFGAEGVEVWGPEAHEALQPLVDLAEGSGLDGVED
jgi:hypothetical protein